MDSEIEAILKEINYNRSASTVTSPRSGFTEIHYQQPSGSKIGESIGVRASNNENSDSEDDDYSPRASQMKDLKHPGRPLFQNEYDVDVTIHSNEDSDI